RPPPTHFSNSEPGPVFPALSRQSPATEALPLSGPAYGFVASHDSTPDVASPPVKFTPTEGLCQPFAFGCLAPAAVTEGFVASYLSVKEPGPLFPALSRQAPVTAVESVSGPAERAEEGGG